MLQVNINPKDIEQAVTSAILDSALGDKIKSVIQITLDEFDKGAYGGRSPLQTAIEAEMQKIVLLVLRDEYDEKLRDAVRVKLTDKVVDDIVNKAWNAFMDK